MDATMSRRRALAGLGIGAAVLAVGTAGACSGSESGGGSGADPTTATTYPLAGVDATLGGGAFSLFAQDDLNFQTLFALGEAGQIACTGEVIAVVAEANAAPGGATYQSLFDAWIAMADRLEEAAAASERAGNRVTAQAQYVRAAKYLAQALYWVYGTSDPGQEKALCTTMGDAFAAGMRLSPTPAEPVSIPYDAGELPGWFLRPATDDTRRPTIIMNNGSDGQLVDLLGQGGLAALARGYNVLLFEGPGQGSMLFVDDVPFRPDWNAVITPIVDWLGRRSDVARDQVVLRGISFGGLLTPQAASEEHRLAALVADPGSLQTKDDYPAVIQDAGDAGTAEQVNAAWQVVTEGATPQQRFNLLKSMSIFTRDAHDAAVQGRFVTDFDTLWKAITRYDVTGVLGEITTPTMVTQYEGDTAFGTQGQQMYDALTVSDKAFVEFTSVDGAQYHCGPLAPQVTNEAMWDWVDGVLGRRAGGR